MKKLLCLFFIFLLLSSCDRLFDSNDSDESKPGYLDYLPEKTQVGANTFGCYINGELAASKSRYQIEGVKSSMLGPYDYVNGFWGIYSGFLNREKVDTIMRLRILLKQAYLSMEFDSLHRDKYNCEVYIQFRDNPDLSGSVVTTVDITKLDRSNHIISGEFKAINVPLYRIDSVVHLRKGRFDIKYGTKF